VHLRDLQQDGARQPCVCFRVPRIQFHRAGEQRFLLLQDVQRLRPVVGGDAPHQEIERTGIDVARQAAAGCGNEDLAAYRIGDAASDAILERQQFAFVAVKAFGPDLMAGGTVDQVRIDTHLGLDALQAAGQHVLHRQLPAHLPGIGAAAIEGGRRGRRYHHQTGDARQVCGDRVAQPLGKVGLLDAVAQAGEGQDDQGQRLGARSRPRLRLATGAGIGLHLHVGQEAIAAPRDRLHAT
jgi:hypothetical protein